MVLDGELGVTGDIQWHKERSGIRGENTMLLS